MPDVLIMNHAHHPMNPPSPTSSVTFVDYPSSPGFSKPWESTIYGPSNSMLVTEANSDVTPANFLAQAQAILSDTDIPREVIKEAISAQYATCEKYRTHLMSKMWEVKEINWWKRFLKRTIATLQKEHRVAQSGLKLWLDLAEKQISRESAQTIQTYRQDEEALSSVRMDFNHLEGLAIARGITDTNFTQEDLHGDDSDDNSTMTDDDDLVAIKKPGHTSNINPCLQPDCSQLGLPDEYTQPPPLYDNLSAMIEEDKDEDEGENKDEGEGEGYEQINDLPQFYERPQIYNTPQEYDPCDPKAPQHYQPLPYYPPVHPQLQMRYWDLPPSSPLQDYRSSGNTLGHHLDNVPSSSRQQLPLPTASNPHDRLPSVPTFGDLIPSSIWGLEPVTTSRFSSIE
ncbi:hypothetical protein BDR07DRAFT_1492879 [Suillus spraguei]|nr:hypothetical protein BDR07DRAFT_1492879 [Suillus spraguei]